MTIQEYSNKINNLRVEEIPQFSDDNDVENVVLKLLKDTNKNYFTIETLFNQSTPEAVVLNSEIIKLFTDHLGLLLSSEKESGNVCFANSSELRPEFRQTCTAIDILDYTYAFVHYCFYKEFQKIVIPSEVNLFWQLVKIGYGLRKGNK
ncbi:hypothetical protein [Flavobacterium limi]|uniref:Type ISP restriction-modification enzyme LLaBIII C-terminal specificity domain-containing protein n=1 Tax=Flavobacterium limi TaxID=2045105 RepID=A0ABQ1UKS7_9FLAO|nr:hypothetical protein [Flavobacterium limi]GGF21168.1 hypothetical protein GCM10011518_32940 [Flavobacterium limi]